MSEISERYWKRKIPVHQKINTPWGEGQEIGISAQYIIVKFKDGTVKNLEEAKINEKFEYMESD